MVSLGHFGEGEVCWNISYRTKDQIKNMNKQSRNVNEEISRAKQSVKIGGIRKISEYSSVE